MCRVPGRCAGGGPSGRPIRPVGGASPTAVARGNPGGGGRLATDGDLVRHWTRCRPDVPTGSGHHLVAGQRHLGHGRSPLPQPDSGAGRGGDGAGGALPVSSLGLRGTGHPPGLARPGMGLARSLLSALWSRARGSRRQPLPVPRPRRAGLECRAADSGASLVGYRDGSCQSDPRYCGGDGGARGSSGEAARSSPCGQPTVPVGDDDGHGQPRSRPGATGTRLGSAGDPPRSRSGGPQEGALLCRSSVRRRLRAGCPLSVSSAGGQRSGAADLCSRQLDSVGRMVGLAGPQRGASRAVGCAPVGWPASSQRVALGHGCPPASVRLAGVDAERPARRCPLGPVDDGSGLAVRGCGKAEDTVRERGRQGRAPVRDPHRAVSVVRGGVR